jgi:hypothetical protein
MFDDATHLYQAIILELAVGPDADWYESQNTNRNIRGIHKSSNIRATTHRHQIEIIHAAKIDVRPFAQFAPEATMQDTQKFGAVHESPRSISPTNSATLSHDPSLYKPHAPHGGMSRREPTNTSQLMSIRSTADDNVCNMNATGAASVAMSNGCEVISKKTGMTEAPRYKAGTARPMTCRR